MKQRNFSLIGGDFRNETLAKLLKMDGHIVKTYSLLDSDELTISDALLNSQIVIGPMPFSEDGIYLKYDKEKSRVKINELFENISSDSLFVAGKIDNEIYQLAKNKSITVQDFLKREDFAVLNAIPTAEGAIYVAMKETNHTINQSNILIIGNGRIGKTLSNMLKGLGAKVHITCRKAHDKAYAKALGVEVIDFEDFHNYLHSMEIIFNTAPSLVLDEHKLKNISTSSVIIDLASKPGGVDFKKADELGLKTNWALALPGKVAPLTAAKIIKDTVYNIICELEE